MKTFIIFTVIAFLGCNKDNLHSTKVAQLYSKQEISTIVCDNPDYNCTGLQIRPKRFYRTNGTNLNCCPLQSPIMIAVRNTYYNYTGSTCEIGYNNLNLSTNFSNWTSIPCQAKFSDCGYCGKFEFIVRWCDTTVFNYVFEFELDGPCGSQTFAVCNSNGPASCTYSSFMSGTTRIYDAVFHYTIDDDCCFVLSTECENILCAASSSDDCPINFECSPEE